MKVAWVFLGGGIGAAARFGVYSLLEPQTLHGFPWPTFIVNMLGCLLIGFCIPLLRDNIQLSLLIITGFLGGFTTFSTFGLDAYQLGFESGNWKTFTGYLLGSNVLGVLFVVLGVYLNTRLT